MSESHRDAGLLRTVGFWGLTAGIVNTLVGASIFIIPATLSACIGPYAPLAFVACAVAVGAVAICFAEAGSRVPTSGGAYVYVESAFGARAGYVAGIFLWFSNVLASGSIAAALGDVAGSVLPVPVRSVGRVVAIVGVLGGVALLNVGGVARGQRLVNVATVLKLAPLAIFVLVGAGAVHGASFSQPVTITHTSLGRAVILALFALTGMEGPLSASGEVVEPSRTIPRALVASLVSVSLLYVAIQVVAQGILGPALAGSAVPLADGMSRVSPALRTLMLVGAAVSMFGWIGSDILGTSRVVFGFARDGWLPRALGRLNPRTHAPQAAILSYSAVALALALSGTFAELAVLAALSSAGLYIGACAAAVRLVKRGVAQAGAPLAFRGLVPAAAVGIAGMVVMVALASRDEIVGFFALLAASTVGAWFFARRLPPAPASLGGR